MMRKLVAVAVACAMSTGCATWSASEVKNAAEGDAQRHVETQARDILIGDSPLRSIRTGWSGWDEFFGGSEVTDGLS